jgi:hypothetical protein
MFSAFHNTVVGLGAVTLALAVGGSLPAQGAYTVTFLQHGPDVVATGSGSIDLTALGPVSTGSSASGQILSISPFPFIVTTGPVPIMSVDSYTPAPGVITGPTNFGSVAGGSASSGNGDLVGINNLFGGFTLFVPVGYVSGHALSDTSTYDNATFASLGVTPGTHEWTWGTGTHADSFTLQIGAVPEPASLSLLAMGLAGLGMVLRTRRT